MQLQRLRRRRLDAAVLVLCVEEEVGRVVLGEVAVRARLAAGQLQHRGVDVVRPQLSERRGEGDRLEVTPALHGARCAVISSIRRLQFDAADADQLVLR